LVNLLDLLSGGTVSTFSVLAMGVYPYITAQIILQLLVPIIPRLQRIQEEDPRQAREFMERWTYYLAVPMAALNAFGQIRLILSLPNNTGAPILSFAEGLGFNLPSVTMIIAMTGGTMFAIWLGELISEYGIRNQGLSLIIFAGIVARIPSNLVSLLSNEDTRWRSLAVFLALVALMVLAIVFVQQGRRNVPVMYPGRRIGQRQSMPVKGNLPLQVNMAGMIPVIFAQSILTFPAIIAQFFVASQTAWVSRAATSISELFGGQSEWYWLLFFIMVVGFTFFYTDVIFSQQNYGENLKRVGAQVPGVTKGGPTQKYLTKVLRRITLPGAVFLGVVAVMPFLVQPLLPGAGQLSILSTGLLIVVGVVRDTFFGLDAELKLRGYDETLLVR
jgi:preprotein translocase subunit SecY